MHKEPGLLKFHKCKILFHFCILQKYFHSFVERQAGCRVGCEITDLAVCAVVARLCIKCHNYSEHNN